MGSIFRSLSRPGSSATTCTWRGTSPWPASARCRSRMLSIRDRAFAELGDRDLGDLEVEGSVAAASRSTRSPTSRRPSSRTCARRVEGHVTVPCFLDRPAARPGSRYRLGAGRAARSGSPATPTAPAFICNIPRSADAGRPRAAVAVRPRPVRRRGRGARRQRRAARQREQRAGVRAPTGSGWPRDDVPNALGILRTCRASPAWPTASSRASSTSCSSGARWSTRPGLRRHPAFREGTRPLIDTRRLFYYGNSQGGIAGGALDRGRPGLQPLGAVRGRDELQPPARRAAWTSTRSAAVLNPSYPDQLAAPAAAVD